MPKRLPRDRYLSEWKIAFTLNVSNRARIFTDGEVVAAHVAMLERATLANECVVPIYCFMPDHVHLLIMGASESSDLLSAIIKYKNLSGYWMYQRKLPTWQTSFYDHVLRVNEDWHNQVWYIAQNPVRSGLVEHWLDYPFTGSLGCDLVEIVAGFA